MGNKRPGPEADLVKKVALETGITEAQVREVDIARGTHP